mgnify:CR=1 FL=1
MRYKRQIVSPFIKPLFDRFIGSPPHDVNEVIKNFISNEMSNITYLNFSANINVKDIICIQPNHNYCDSRRRMFLYMYDSCVWMVIGPHTKSTFFNVEYEKIVEYSDPNLIDIIERFINSI